MYTLMFELILLRGRIQLNVFVKKKWNRSDVIKIPIKWILMDKSINTSLIIIKQTWRKTIPSYQFSGTGKNYYTYTERVYSIKWCHIERYISCLVYIMYLYIRYCVCMCVQTIMHVYITYIPCVDVCKN